MVNRDKLISFLCFTYCVPLYETDLFGRIHTRMTIDWNQQIGSIEGI